MSVSEVEDNMSVSVEKSSGFDPMEMLGVIKRLSVVLQTEVSLLKEMKLSCVHELYDEKIKLLSVMEGYKETLSSNRGFLGSISKKLRSEIVAANNEFEVLVEQDGKQVKRARLVHDLVMRAIGSVVQSKITKSSVYNKYGLMDDGKKKMIYTPPVSISESF